MFTCAKILNRHNTHLNEFYTAGSSIVFLQPHLTSMFNIYTGLIKCANVHSESLHIFNLDTTTLLRYYKQILITLKETR